MQSLKSAFRFLGAFSAAVILYSCASIGNPSGGPKDEAPPVPVRFNPPQGATNVTRDRIEIDFNEIVNVKDAFSKVVVSPPQKSMPRVSASGRKIIVQFTDSLLPNTTYTIDFANSIEDNNEGNRLNSLIYSFSTGPYIDTLRISGTVLNARDLEPQKSMLVGVHSVLADSAFRTLPFTRMAKTDDRGRFSIRGLAPGNYRLFALGDLNGDYRWDNPEELIAFHPSVISPSAQSITATDTIYNLLTAQIDTVITVPAVKYLPDDILLLAFDSGFRQQYIVKNERPDSARISLIFNTRNSSLPLPRVIGRSHADDWYIAEHSRFNDTITYWLKDPSLISADTLQLAVDYTAAVRPHEEKEVTDTLKFIFRRTPPKKVKNDTKTPEKPVFLSASVYGSGTHDITAPLYIEFGEPPVRIDSAAFRVETLVDTVWHPVDGIRLQRADTLNPRRFSLEHKWTPGAKYRLTTDSLAVTGISGLQTDRVLTSFNIRKSDEYATLTLEIHGVPASVPAIVELLTGDKPVRTAPVKNGKADFQYLMPGNYYARLFLDYNGNGEFDTGDYDLLSQPEDVFYYPKRIRVKKFWDLSQSWDINALPSDQQKPLEIKKNKPDTGKRGSQNSTLTDEDEEADFFDPRANPFDPNDKNRRKREGSAYY